jgi:hypothetical protein
MSFDIFLQRFEGGEPAPISRDSVRRVLHAHDYSDPTRTGFYNVRFPDGVEVEFSASGLENEKKFDNCSFHVRGTGPYLITFIWDMADAGDMVILPAMEEPVAILTSPGQLSHLPPDAIKNFRPVVCSSPNQLGELLFKGYDGWSEYREQVVTDISIES